MPNEWGLKEWIDGWGRTVAWVETDPESFLYDEYRNAIAKRDGVTFALGDDPEAGAPHATRIAALDRRFREATFEVSEPVITDRRRLAWWWSRLPNRLGEEMRSALSDLAPTAASAYEQRTAHGDGSGNG